MLYRRLVEGLDSKGILIPENDDIYKYINNLDTDHYCSIYLYNEDQKKKFYEPLIKIKNGKEIETINGAAGISDVVTKSLVFDFDIDKHANTSLEEVRKDTVEAVNRLLDLGFSEESILVSFSGNKGFGIEIGLLESITPDQHKEIAKKIAGDLKTTDTKIYNASRILRIPHTKHQSSGLYKTPISISELEDCTIDEIKDIAKEKYEKDEFLSQMGSYINVNLPEKLKKVEKVEKKKKKAYDITLESEVCNLDFSKKPKWLSHWKYALSEGYFPPGTRSYALMILGATYASQGLNKLTTYRMLKGAAELQSNRFDQDRFDDEEIWTNIIEQVYSPQWQGGTYSEDSFPDDLSDYLQSLGIPRTKVDDNAFVTADDVFDVFEDFAENIEQNTVKTGIAELDKKCRITTSMLVGILGAPAAGKTATLLNILNKHSLDGESSIFFSFDMGKPLVYQKLAQKFTGYQSDDLFAVFQEKNEKEKLRIRKSITKNFENTQMCFRTGSSVDDMRRYIEDFQEKTEKKVRMIAVDYLEKLVGPFSDATANSGYNAAKLQELANDLEMAVLVLLQPQKLAGDPSEPLLTYRRIKGASILEQDCRVILSVYREGYSAKTFDNDNFITYNILKNTMGELGTVDCYWDGLTGSIDTIDDVGREELKALRGKLLEKKLREAQEL